ncbi:MAG: hypothetical protein ACYTF0_09435, partial [Planctomycetota bacterium]|jgi:hypothetical protein
LSGAGPWREPISLATGRHQLRVSRGDAVPVTLTATVVDVPTVAAISASVTPPAYLGGEVMTVPTPAALDVLAGSEISLHFSLDGDDLASGEEAAISIDDQQLPVLVDPAGGYRCTWLATTAGDVRIALARRYRNGDEEITVARARDDRIPLRLLADHPPQVSISGVRGEEAVAVGARVELTTDAFDDHALADLRLLAADIVEDDEATEHLIHAWDDVAGVGGRVLRRHQLVVAINWWLPIMPPLVLACV